MSTPADLSTAADRHEQRVLAALIFAAATVALVSTLGIPVIPVIAADFGVPLDDAQWILTITLVVGAVATPVLGRLGDGARRARVLIAAQCTVVVGCVVSATAGSFEQMLIGRGLQGIGYATVPLAISVAREQLSEPLRRKGIAALSVTVAIGLGLGFPVTGALASVWNSGAAYWFGAIFSAAAVVTVRAAVPLGPRSAARMPIDGLGVVLLSGALAALLLGVTRAGRDGWGSGLVLGLLGAAAALLTLFALVELHERQPLVDLRLMSQRAVVGTNAAAMLMAVSMYIALSLVSRVAQTPASTGYGLGASAATAGLLLLPLSAGSFVSQPAALAAGSRLGLRVVLPAGAMIMGITQVALGLWHGSLWALAAAIALLGIGVGSTFALMPGIITASVPPERTGSAMSLHQVVRAVGGALGSALSVTILAGHTNAGAAFPSDAGYGVAFALSFALCAAAAAVALVAVPPAHGAGAGRVAATHPAGDPAIVEADAGEDRR
ncbi:MAG: MFS transporter [Thermoleophilaceae bacterium]